MPAVEQAFSALNRPGGQSAHELHWHGSPSAQSQPGAGQSRRSVWYWSTPQPVCPCIGAPMHMTASSFPPRHPSDVRSVHAPDSVVWSSKPVLAFNAAHSWRTPSAVHHPPGPQCAVGDFDGIGDGLVLGTALGEYDGDADGKMIGDVDGDTLGDADGLTLGLSLGEVDGEELGLALGLALGDVDGEALGLADGRSLGEVDGETLGELDGIADGDVVGAALGLVDGLALGRVDGEALGEPDGTNVGAMVGQADGDSLGLDVGLVVGAAVGVQASAPDNFPTAPAIPVIPNGHVEHRLFPSAPWKNPFGQSIHSRWPVHATYVPAVQFVHVAAAAFVDPIGPYMPAEHAVPEHDVSLLQKRSLYCPDGHAAHVLHLHHAYVLEFAR